jgi:hypothetical protein
VRELLLTARLLLSGIIATQDQLKADLEPLPRSEPAKRVERVEKP